MKIYCLLIFAFCLTSLSAQTVTSERVANLNPENYAIEGDATLSAYDNGTLELNLSDDFTTPEGPDVRLFLGTSISLTNAVEIVDLSSVNHFSGAYSVSVPAGIELEDYDYVFFFCVAFNQLWASGQFGETTIIGGGFECLESTTTTRNGVASVDLCVVDGVDDEVFLQNNINTPPGENYVFLLTDTNEVLLEVISDSIYNFEGSNTEEMRVYGLHYAGELSPAIGENRANTTASECYIHSGGGFFLAVHSTASCSSATFDTELARRVNAYPVPASNLLTINFPAGFSPQYFQLANLNGRVVVQNNTAAVRSLQINVSQLPAGTYFLQLWDKKRAVSKRISIAR